MSATYNNKGRVIHTKLHQATPQRELKCTVVWFCPIWTIVEQHGTPPLLMNSNRCKSLLGRLSARTGTHPTPPSFLNANGYPFQPVKKTAEAYCAIMSILKSTFTPHSSPSLRHPHNRILLMPITKIL